MWKQVLVILGVMLMLAASIIGQDETLPEDIETLAVVGITSNTDWEPYVREFDGVEMVLVPAGCFLMGSTDGQIEAVFEMCEALRGEGECYHPLYERESPQHEICFDEPFWIDRTEVTNGQFATFGGVAELESDFPDDDLPREMVSWFEGRDYCDQRGARLPTEAEWEYAARGPDSLVYPWGNQFDGTRLNYCDQNCTFDWADQAYDDGYEKVAPVGSYEGGFSWVGAYDMSGNVWEWTSTIFGYREEDQWQEIFPFPYDPSDGRETISDENTAWRVLRGGSWRYDNNIAHSASRHGNYPDLRGDNTGFRCVRSYNNGD